MVTIAVVRTGHHMVGRCWKDTTNDFRWMQSAQFLDGFDQPLDESKTNEDKSTMKFVKEPGAT
jgi:hypothetical protein